MTTPTHRILNRTSLSILMAVALAGCAQGVMQAGDSPQKPGDPSVPSQPPLEACGGVTLELPLADSVVGSTTVQVKGQVAATDGVLPAFVAVDETPTPVVDGRFNVTLERPVGAHTLVVRCADTQSSREYQVRLGPPRIVIERPETGEVIPPEVASVNVSGQVQNHQGVASVSVNGAQLTLDETGRFQTNIQPRPGMNHLDFEAVTQDGRESDIRRSFLHGKLARFESDPGSKVAIQVRPSAFEALAAVLERDLTDDVLEDMLDPLMGRNGDIELHEIRYDRLEVTFVPENDRVRVRLRLHDFGLKVTYHYLLGRIRGWARVDPAEIEADLDIRMTVDGGYDLAVRNPQVRLHDFDLDLNELYSLIEGLVQPMVHDMGREALMGVMEDMVIEDIVQADLLNQPLAILGHTTALQMNLDQLQVTPDGVQAVANTTVSPFPPVKELPGIWTAGSNQLPTASDADVSAGMSVDVFNRLAAHAVRGGLLDRDLAELLGEDAGIAGSLSVGVLAGVTGADLLSVFAPDAPISMHTKALMQPVIRVIEVPTVGFALNLGGLRIHLASPDADGRSIPWAVLELSGTLKILPTFVDDSFQLGVEFAPRIEVVEAPLMPLDEGPFEDFLETLVAGLADGALGAQVNEAVDFAGIDLFGLSMDDARLSFDPATPDFINFGVELGHR